MNLTKATDKGRVEMTPEEEAKVRSEWEAETSPERERGQMVLTRYQARSALLSAGLLDDVETLMAASDTPRDIVLMWQHKERIRRTHPATIQMAKALGWSDEQIDDLFRAGMAIEP